MAAQWRRHDLRVESVADGAPTIPRLFSPRKQDEALELQHKVRLNRLQRRIERVLLSREDFDDWIEHICLYTKADPMASSSAARRLIQKTGIRTVDQLQQNGLILPLSHADFLSIRMFYMDDREAKLNTMLPIESFIMFPRNDENIINGFNLLEYIHRLHKSFVLLYYASTRLSSGGGEYVSYRQYEQAIQVTIVEASDAHLNVDTAFREYYDLICSRILLLRQDVKPDRGRLPVDSILECTAFQDFMQLMHRDLADMYNNENNRFHPSHIRNIHRQFIQLDRDKNGSISPEELKLYGQTRAFNPVELRPIHDLTSVFIHQVLNEISVSKGRHEMTYETYIDFTLVMSDMTSMTSLRFFWRVLDIHKQGFLDTFTLNYFLRELLDKIRLHERDDSLTLDRLRNQIVDAIAPRDPHHITWNDIRHCNVAHSAVRMLVDYVTYSSYQ